MKRLRAIISANIWPLIILGLLSMSITANGILVYVATRPGVPGPIEEYYHRSQQWDADRAKLAASQELGWTVKVAVPPGKHFALSERRPVDVSIHDRAGKPVTGLKGRIFAMRPANTSLNGFSPLVELPHAPGNYRSIARLTAAGLWELSIDATWGETPFIYTTRVNVDGPAPEPTKGAARR